MFLKTKDFTLTLLVAIFEAYFPQENLPDKGPKLTFEAYHVLLSVGIATNVSDFQEGECFVTNGDENELVQKRGIIWKLRRVLPTS